MYGAWVKAALDRGAEHRVVDRHARDASSSQHGRIVGLAMEDGDAYSCRCARRDDGHVSQRARSTSDPSSSRPGAPASRRRASWRRR